MAANYAVPSEFSEQSSLVVHLNNCGIYFYAIPNGGERSQIAAIKASQEGVRAGASDLYIMDSPPIQPRRNIESGIRCPGIYVEMKRIDGTLKDVSDDQKRFIREAVARGYGVIVAMGCRDAIRQLRLFGYQV
jgi:hypothetical protein